MDWRNIKPYTPNNIHNEPKPPDERTYQPQNYYLQSPYEPRTPSYEWSTRYVTPRQHPPTTYPTRDPYLLPKHHPQPRPYGEGYPSLYSEDINIHPPRPQQMQHPLYHSNHSPTPHYDLRSNHSSPKKHGMSTLLLAFSFKMLLKIS